MKRIARAATLTVASCALVMGGAGAAMAYDDGGWKKDHGKHYGKHHNGHKDHDEYNDDDDYGNVGNSASAEATTVGSGGFLSGNIVQVPINIPINVCGNTFNSGLSFFNPSIGNVCVNGASIDDHDEHHDDDHDNRRYHH
ncbi:chaplin [Streptomyces sp. 8N616]|uniref:chaplin n=1 Tax=Streptomyces sp. 8N616 TaxID=3457414 RepID=UPI003FD22FCA